MTAPLPLCDNPDLNDLPYQIESTTRGQLIMTPHSIPHSDLQVEIILLLKYMASVGRVSVEYALLTSDGEKTIDVTWRTKITGEKRASIAPELCIEVFSPSNTMGEMRHKKSLYFEAGAKEVWFCRDGEMFFFNAKGALPSSVLFPYFPCEVILND